LGEFNHDPFAGPYRCSGLFSLCPDERSAFGVELDEPAAMGHKIKGVPEEQAVEVPKSPVRKR